MHINQVQAKQSTALTAFATITNFDGLRMLKRLCKHFSHKVPAGWDEHQGYIEFAMGFCDMTTEYQQLNLRCGAKTQTELLEIIDCINTHFLRFATQADRTLTWDIKNS